MAAKRIDLRLQPGWHLTLSKSGETRYFYQGKRKSFDAYTRSRERAQRREAKKFAGWLTKRAYKKEMSSNQAQRWIKFSGIETDDEGYPNPESSFALNYRLAYEDDWNTSPHRAFAEFLESIDVREEDADYPVGDTETVE